MAAQKNQLVLINGRAVRALKIGVDVEAYITRQAEKGVKAQRIKGQVPTMATLERYASDTCRATDGCKVEGDGVCPHGHPSWLKVLGMM